MLLMTGSAHSMRLYPYQKDALLKLRTGSILNGGVGSGKSITALAYYVKSVGGDAEKRSLPRGCSLPDLYIITTARKRDTREWNVELAKIGIDADDPERSFGKAHVVIDSWNNIGKYTGARDSFFIFDEQRVVGNGAWVKSFYKIAKKPTTNQWILLSATPGDTWMDYIPVFVANGFYRNRTEFIREHVVYDNYSKFPKIRGYLNEQKLYRLRSKVLVKMDVKRSVKRTTVRIPVTFDKKAYSRILDDRQNPYDGTPIKNVSQFCALQRYCSNSDPSRLEAVKLLARDHDRLIIFYNFDYELNRLRELKKLRGYSYGEWNGHAHDPLPKTKRWIYVVQYAAGSEGWNCTSTDSMVFYSLPYSYKQYEQACGRIDRINTPYSELHYYRLENKSRIDHRVISCIAAKKNFNVLDEKEYFEARRSGKTL